MTHVNTEEMRRAAQTADAAADSMRRSAGEVEEAVRRLEQLLGDGYGGNGVRLIELLDNLEVPVASPQVTDERIEVFCKAYYPGSMSGPAFVAGVKRGLCAVFRTLLSAPPAADTYFDGVSEAMNAGHQVEAKPVAAELETSLTVFDMGLGFALCHRDFEDTRNAIKKLQTDFTAIRAMLAGSPQEQAPSGSAALNVLRNIIEDGYLSETNMHRGRRILDGSQEHALAFSKVSISDTGAPRGERNYWCVCVCW